MLRVLVYAGIVVNRQRVFLLGIDITATDGDSVEFICPNTPPQDLFPSSFCIEIPFSVSINDGNGERPIIISDGDGGCGWLG